MGPIIYPQFQMANLRGFKTGACYLFFLLLVLCRCLSRVRFIFIPRVIKIIINNGTDSVEPLRTYTSPIAIFTYK